MNRKWKWAALALIALVTTVAWAGQGSHAPPFHSDFALFTTEGSPGRVLCTASGAAELHLTVTNLDPDANQVRLEFLNPDGIVNDSVTVMVPTGESFSLTQVIGTHPAVDGDGFIRVVPGDTDLDTSPMVGWASIHREEGGAKVTCESPATTFP